MTQVIYIESALILPCICFVFYQVEFQICESRKNNTKNAISVHVLGAASKDLGFVAYVHNGSGFIESADHEKGFEFKIK